MTRENIGRGRGRGGGKAGGAPWGRPPMTGDGLNFFIDRRGPEKISDTLPIGDKFSAFFFLFHSSVKEKKREEHK